MSNLIQDNLEQDFMLTLPIEKSYSRKDADGEEHFYIAGLASATVIDYDDERMSESAIMAFKSAIDEGIILPPNNTWSLIPLRSGHGEEWDDVLGWVVKADVDEFHNLWIEAELNDTSKARDLYNVLTTPQKKGRPTQLGFSVGGKIKKAAREWNQERQKSIRVFEEIALREVSVTGKPSCPPSYVEALTKSVDWESIPRPQQEITKERTMNDEAKEVQVAQVETPKVAEGSTPVVETPAQVNKDNNVTVPNITEKVQTDSQTDDKDAKIADLEQRLLKLETAQSAVPTQKEVLANEAANSSANVTNVATEEEGKNENAETTPTEKAHTFDIEDVKKSLEGTFVNAITSALNVFKAEAIDPIVADLQTMKTTVQEMAEQPIDKSYSVRTAKETETLVEKFHSNVKSNSDAKKSLNPIAEAVKLAVREKE